MTANYSRAVEESINLLQLYDIDQAPIDLDQLLDCLSLTVECIPYSRFAAEADCDIEAAILFFESDLGAVAYNRAREKYKIFYNDTKNNRGLERFTIAHELGHIFLDHHQDSKTNILLRKNISDEQYQIYENEANCFARNLLSPIPLVERITDINHDSCIHDIMGAFDVSHTAAIVRRKFYILDKYRMNTDYYNYFNGYNILYDYYCLNCDNAEVDIHGYCKICGEKDAYFDRSSYKIHYEGIELDHEKRAVRCPKCSNEIYSEAAKFCKICGTSPFNLCEGTPIHDAFGNIVDYIYHINDGNARYCTECGSKTQYYKQGFLKDWKDIVVAKYGEPNSLYGTVAERRTPKYGPS